MAGKPKKPKEEDELKKQKIEEDEDVVADPLKDPEEPLEEEEDEWMDDVAEEEKY
mgnify:CR=1 FL=1